MECIRTLDDINNVPDRNPPDRSQPFGTDLDEFSLPELRARSAQKLAIPGDMKPRPISCFPSVEQTDLLHPIDRS